MTSWHIGKFMEQFREKLPTIEELIREEHKAQEEMMEWLEPIGREWFEVGRTTHIKGAYGHETIGKGRTLKEACNNAKAWIDSEK